jgi:hypothetical protein
LLLLITSFSLSLSFFLFFFLLDATLDVTNDPVIDGLDSRSLIRSRAFLFDNFLYDTSFSLFSLYIIIRYLSCSTLHFAVSADGAHLVTCVIPLVDDDDVRSSGPPPSSGVGRQKFDQLRGWLVDLSDSSSSSLLLSVIARNHGALSEGRPLDVGGSKKFDPCKNIIGKD